MNIEDIITILFGGGSIKIAEISVGQLIYYLFFFVPYVGSFMALIEVSAILEPLIGFILALIIGLLVAYLWDRFILRKIWKDKRGITYYIDNYYKKKFNKKK